MAQTKIGSYYDGIQRASQRLKSSPVFLRGKLRAPSGANATRKDSMEQLTPKPEINQNMTLDELGKKLDGLEGAAELLAIVAGLHQRIEQQHEETQVLFEHAKDEAEHIM